MGAGRFSVALQMRIGALGAATQPATSATALSCDCGYIAPSLDIWHAHVGGCAVRPGYNSSSRAADLNHGVKGYIRDRRPDLTPELSPPADGPKGALLADILVHLPSGDAIIDWRVFNPLSASEPSARTAEQEKERKYEGALVPVIPAVISAPGGFTATTLRVVRAIESACDAEHNSLVRRISFLVGSGTASMIISARLRAGLTQRRSKAIQAAFPTPCTALSVADLPPLSPADLADDDFEKGVLHEVAISISSPTPNSCKVVVPSTAPSTNFSSSVTVVTSAPQSLSLVFYKGC